MGRAATGRTEKEVERRQAIAAATAIDSRILLVRGHRVMLDSDLAALYAVPTKVLLQAVKRNRARFPEDFMLQLTQTEFEDLRSRIVTSSSAAGHGGRRYAPHAFTEQGVAMLSSVLRSPRAIRVNIEIMRAFVRLRQMLGAHAELARKLAELERRYDSQFRVVFDAIRELMQPPARSQRQIGFQAGPPEPKPRTPRQHVRNSARRAAHCR